MCLFSAVCHSLCSWKHINHTVKIIPNCLQVWVFFGGGGRSKNVFLNFSPHGKEVLVIS